MLHLSSFIIVFLHLSTFESIASWQEPIVAQLKADRLEFEQAGRSSALWRFSVNKAEQLRTTLSSFTNKEADATKLKSCTAESSTLCSA
jgi:hypothetical protein